VLYLLDERTDKRHLAYVNEMALTKTKQIEDKTFVRQPRWFKK